MNGSGKLYTGGSPYEMDQHGSQKRQRKIKPPKVRVDPIVHRVRPVDLRRFVRNSLLPPDPVLSRVGWGMVDATYQVSLYVLLEFLGPDWLMYYVTKRGLLRHTGPEFNDLNKSIIAISDLAETLVNLRHIDGFKDCLELLADGRIAPGYAELEVGKFLSWIGQPFSFNKRSSEPKKDYDLRVVFKSGEVGCGEIKSKSPETMLSERTVLGSLRDARSQLPDDQPGVIFLKIPEEWLGLEGFGPTIDQAVNRFLRGTDTVVAVEIFATGYRIDLTVMRPIVSGSEVLNRHHKFDREKDWSVIGEIPMGTQISPPPWWISIRGEIDRRVDSRLVKLYGPPMPHSGDDGQLTPEEIAQRRDDAIRRALHTPPTPQKEIVGKVGRAQSEPNPRPLRPVNSRKVQP
jgi:hypothetical protein